MGQSYKLATAKPTRHVRGHTAQAVLKELVWNGATERQAYKKKRRKK